MDTPFYQGYLGDELVTLAGFHMDTVRINNMWFMSQPGSSEIRAVPELGSPSDDGLQFFAKTVYDHGMDSWLALHINYDDWKGGFGWRGDPNWTEWEENYTNYILQYAKFAENNGIDYISIANELPVVITREEYMTGLIRKIKDVYSGQVAVTIDACPMENYKLIPAGVLKESDIIGLNLYPSPQTFSGATVEEMTRKLIPYFNRVADHFSGVDYKSLVITEFGVSRLDGSTSVECTWMTPKTDQEDLQEMADYYQAFAMALEQSRLRPMIDGVMLHHWRINETVFKENFVNLDINYDMIPRGNAPALKIISDWYSTLEASPR